MDVEPFTEERDDGTEDLLVANPNHRHIGDSDEEGGNDEAADQPPSSDSEG